MRILVFYTTISLGMLCMGCSESTAPETAGDGSSVQTNEKPSVSDVQSETPQDAAAAILALLKSEDYSTLVRERYSELPRVLAMPESPSSDELIEQVSASLAKQREMFIKVYSQLAEAEFTIQPNLQPQPGETDQMAVAPFIHEGKEVLITLYKMESGRWGFHL